MLAQSLLPTSHNYSDSLGVEKSMKIPAGDGLEFRSIDVFANPVVSAHTGQRFPFLYPMHADRLSNKPAWSFFPQWAA